MQKDTKEKSLAVRKAELENLLTEAVEHHNHVEVARSAVANAQQLALFHAWQAGIRLNNMKKLVGHGNWQSWCEINFCKPFGISDRTARLYMKIDTDNAHLRDLPPNRQRVADLKFNTIVHASLCSSGGMISLLMKPGNLAIAVSWCAFQVAKASSLPGRTLAVAMRTAGSLMVTTGLFFHFC